MTQNLSSSPNNQGNKLRNILIALVAIVLSLTLALGIQTGVNSESLDTQAEKSTPLEIAVSNGKPSLVEFYANWCTSCQAMAKDLAIVKQEYQNEVNFVMLNIDNSKWLPEILRYRVEGIPHFIYLDNQGKATAQSIGEQPLSILKANLSALIANSELPYAYSQGDVSEIEPPSRQIQGNQDDPRNHGNPIPVSTF
jgi:thiol-disulfide isomerase/thioredoxin